MMAVSRPIPNIPKRKPQGVGAPWGWIFLGKEILSTMNIRTRRTARKAAVKTSRPVRNPEVGSYAERWIMDRYDVSPSLARTIASLAMLGGGA